MPNISAPKLSQKQVVMIIGGIVVVGGLFALIFLNTRPKPPNTAAVKLTVWGTEDQETFEPIAASYPYGTVTYKQITGANYQQQVVSALAAGDGPDVFEIGDHDLPQYLSVLAPMPATYATTYGAPQLDNYFPQVVTQDFTSGGQVYGLPLSVDTLAMIYNKDLLNTAGIAFAPKTWQDFENDITKLRTEDSAGNITEAAAAIGGSETTIPNAPDILSLLMLQNGTTMTASDNTSAQFAAAGSPGLAAFNFYLQFTDPSSQYYTWNDTMSDAIDAFVNGKVAIIFGYASDLATIKAKAPFMNIGVAAVPQPVGATVSVNYPNYSGFVVAKASLQSTAAWNFVLNLTTNDASEKAYLAAEPGVPPALLTEINADMTDPTLGVFAAQALTAKSWYEANSTQTNAIFNTAIESVLNDSQNSTQALDQAEESVTQLMQ